MVLDHFKDTRTAKTFEGFCGQVRATDLGLPDGKAKELSYLGRQPLQILVARPDPEDRPGTVPRAHSMPKMVWYYKSTESSLPACGPAAHLAGARQPYLRRIWSVRSSGRAWTVWPRPVMVVARKSEL